MVENGVGRSVAWVYLPDGCAQWGRVWQIKKLLEVVMEPGEERDLVGPHDPLSPLCKPGLG